MIRKITWLLRRKLAFFKRPFWGNYGKNALIDKPLLITNKKHIKVGNNVYIRKYARIEPIVNYGKQTFNPSIIFDDGVVVEQNLHLTCANNIYIGKNTHINSYVFISDIDHDYSDINVPIRNQQLLVQPTEIGEDCFIGTGVKIMAGCHIGKHCVIGANAVVSHDIPDYSVAVGVPAKVIKKYDFSTNKWIRNKE